MKKTLILFSICILLFVSGCGKTVEPKADLIVRSEDVKIDGLNDTHSIVFIADSHISLCDDRDTDVQEKASQRYESFRDDQGAYADSTFSRIIEDTLPREKDMVIFGGDIIDSAMYKSIDFFGDEVKKLNSSYVYLMGNHDFEYGSEYFSPKAYEEYLPRLSELRDGSTYQIREFEDYIILTIDDDSNQISYEALEAFRQVKTMGKPVVLAVHVPFEPLTQSDSLNSDCIEKWGPSDAGKSRVTIGLNGCYPNEITNQFIAEAFEDEKSPVSLVLAGHIHMYHRDMLTDKIPQICAGAAFEREYLYINIHP